MNKELEAMQYFRDNDKFKIVADLVDRQDIKIRDLYEENEKLKEELIEKIQEKSKIEEILQKEHKDFSNEYIPKYKVEKIIEHIDKKRGEFINEAVDGFSKTYNLPIFGYKERFVSEISKIKEMLSKTLKEK